MLSGELARRRAAGGAPGPIELNFTGSAGQSFGAFAVRGVSLRLEGEANDYLGKGLSGGRLAVVPPRALRVPGTTCLVGNVALYGATGGEVYVAGTAGERFGVRNSGARVVVEGVGDHGCEYMTGGLVVVLGPTGRNFAAGMSGGLAFVLDEGGFEQHVNRGMVELGPLRSPAERAAVRHLVEEHARLTGSPRARALLDAWDETLRRLVRVIPTEYRRILEERAEDAGEPGEALAEVVVGLLGEGAESGPILSGAAGAG
jgi:glutamate synthase domain-containing protein 3